MFRNARKELRMATRSHDGTRAKCVAGPVCTVLCMYVHTNFNN
jgi:hypothetical protein